MTYDAAATSRPKKNHTVDEEDEDEMRSLVGPPIAAAAPSIQASEGAS